MLGKSAEQAFNSVYGFGPEIERYKLQENQFRTFFSFVFFQTGERFGQVWNDKKNNREEREMVMYCSWTGHDCFSVQHVWVFEHHVHVKQVKRALEVYLITVKTIPSGIWNNSLIHIQSCSLPEACDQVAVWMLGCRIWIWRWCLWFGEQSCIVVYWRSACVCCWRFDVRGTGCCCVINPWQHVLEVTGLVPPPPPAPLFGCGRVWCVHSPPSSQCAHHSSGWCTVKVYNCIL